MIPRVGETFLISHDLTFETATAITAVLCTIYDSRRAVVVNAQAGSVDSPLAATAHTVSYLWTPSEAGDYAYHLTYSDGTQTWGVRGRVNVLSPVSVYDRWVERVDSWLLDAGVGEEQALLADVHLLRAAEAAVREFEKVRPRLRYQTVTMAADTFEYALPPDWCARFSAIDQLEYPVDDTEQGREWNDEALWEWDELRLKWRFTSLVPQAGETARVYYRTRHRLFEKKLTGTVAITLKAVTGTGTAFLSEIASGDTLTVSGQTFTVDAVTSDTAATVTANANPAIGAGASAWAQCDSVPDADFDAVARYAAGVALERLANQAAGTSLAPPGAGIVYTRTKQQEYAAQAKAMQDAARKTWGGGRSSAWGRWDYLEHHGEVSYWGTNAGYSP